MIIYYYFNFKRKQKDISESITTKNLKSEGMRMQFNANLPLLFVYNYVLKLRHHVLFQRKKNIIASSKRKNTRDGE